MPGFPPLPLIAERVLLLQKESPYCRRGDISRCCCRCCRCHPWAHLPRALPAAPSPTPHKVTHPVKGRVRPRMASASSESKRKPEAEEPATLERPGRRQRLLGAPVSSPTRSWALSRPSQGWGLRAVPANLILGTRRVGLGRGRPLKDSLGCPGQMLFRGAPALLASSRFVRSVSLEGDV